MIASLLSTIVPSRSRRTPANECLSIGAVNPASFPSVEDMMTCPRYDAVNGSCVYIEGFFSMAPVSGSSLLMTNNKRFRTGSGRGQSVRNMDI